MDRRRLGRLVIPRSRSRSLHIDDVRPPLILTGRAAECCSSRSTRVVAVIEMGMRADALRRGMAIPQKRPRHGERDRPCGISFDTAADSRGKSQDAHEGAARFEGHADVRSAGEIARDGAGVAARPLCLNAGRVTPVQSIRLAIVRRRGRLMRSKRPTLILRHADGDRVGYVAIFCGRTRLPAKEADTSRGSPNLPGLTR